MTALAADDVDRADVDDDRGTAGPARALGDERGCAGASGSHIGIDRQVERATRPGPCQRARGTAAQPAAAPDPPTDAPLRSERSMAGTEGGQTGRTRGASL